MIKKSYFIVLIVLFLLFTGFFFWYGYTKFVPNKVSEVGKTFIANETIRHILKVSILNEKAFSSYLLAIKLKDKDLLYDSIDYFDASLGFLKSYKNDNIYAQEIEIKIKDSLNLLSLYKLNFPANKFDLLFKNVDNINKLVEIIERDKWKDLHNQIIVDETNKFEYIVNLVYVVLLSVILIIIILFVWYKKSILEKEKIKNQKLLLNQSKVAAIGEMLGNIAHQWRQPLNVITTAVSGARLNIELNSSIDKESFIECSDLVLNQCIYLSNTIDDFRDFFMSNNENIELISLNKTINKLEDLTKSSFKSNFIKRITKIDENIDIYSNINIIVQAFINICNNTKDVYLERNINSNCRYFFTTIKKSNDYVDIKFRDSGGGIDSMVIDNIFDPYFTTKHKSVGTGIGLYMTHQIITKHLKGAITVVNVEYEFDNKKLKGAEFIIRIPINTIKK